MKAVRLLLSNVQAEERASFIDLVVMVASTHVQAAMHLSAVNVLEQIALKINGKHMSHHPLPDDEALIASVRSMELETLEE